MELTKVLVLNEHKIFSDSLKALLEGTGYFVKKSNNPIEALRFAQAEPFHIIITEEDMPQMTGVEFVKSLKESYTETRSLPKIVVLTARENQSVFQKLIHLNIDAYLSKNISNLDLFSVLKKVLNHEKHFGSSGRALQSKYDSTNTEITFTPKEKQVLELILEEKTTTEIAKIMDISTFTVEGHRKNLLQKTNAKNVVGLIKYALLNNCVSY